MIELKTPIYFEWDEGNQEKNWHKHRVTQEEAEQVFLDPHKQDYPDPAHSKKELRKILVGRTLKGRMLLLVYTIRGDAIRIISARDLNKRKEVDLYEKAA
nr:BrnT family toxin [Nitrosomonas nitrosa]